MSKIRVFGVAMAAAAGIAVLGAGAANAEESAPSTGSADLTALLGALTSGSSETEEVVEEEPGTGSAEGLAALLAQLTSGSAGETPAE